MKLDYCQSILRAAHQLDHVHAAHLWGMCADRGAEGGDHASRRHHDPAHIDCAAEQQLLHCPIERACQIRQAAGGQPMLSLHKAKQLVNKLLHWLVVLLHQQVHALMHPDMLHAAHSAKVRLCAQHDQDC